MERNNKYFDKHGNEIDAGMTIKHDNGDIEMVYETADGQGRLDLGINASNEDYLIRHPELDREYYPLRQFNMKEWEII